MKEDQLHLLVKAVRIIKTTKKSIQDSDKEKITRHSSSRNIR